MGLTAEAFMRTLERPGLENVGGGDRAASLHPRFVRLSAGNRRWARSGVAAGGAPITLRLVKVANMEIGTRRGLAARLAAAPTRASWKPMPTTIAWSDEAMKPENIAAVRLGVASHNLFDLPYALVLAAGKRAARPGAVRDAGRHGQSAAAAPFECTQNLYSLRAGLPQEKFHQRHRLPHAAAGREHRPGEFPPSCVPHHGRTARIGSGWQEQFVAAARGRATVSACPAADAEPPVAATTCASWPAVAVSARLAAPGERAGHRFLLAAQQRWAPDHGRLGAAVRGPPQWKSPLVVAGEEILRRPAPCASVSTRRGPAWSWDAIARRAKTTDLAVACAAADADGWRSMTPQARFERLGHVAEELRRARATSWARRWPTAERRSPSPIRRSPRRSISSSSTGPTPAGGKNMPALRARPKGVVAVVSPWNFPIAIPCGGVAARWRRATP